METPGSKLPHFGVLCMEWPRDGARIGFIAEKAPGFFLNHGGRFGRHPPKKGSGYSGGRGGLRGPKKKRAGGHPDLLPVWDREAGKC